MLLPKNCVLQLFPKGVPHSQLLFKAAPLQSCNEQLLGLLRKGCFRKRFPKDAFYNCSPKLSFFKAAVRQFCFQSRKVAPQSCSSKLLPKAAPEKRSPKFQCCYPKLPQSWSGGLFKAAPQSCCPKMFPGAAPQNCAPKLFSTRAVAIKRRFCKPVHQNGSPKPFCKAAPTSCAPNLLPKAAVQNYRPTPATLQTYTPKRLPKAILPSGSRKRLRKVATESCSPIFFVNCPRKWPKAVVLRSNCFSKLPKTACQSPSLKLPPCAAPQTCAQSCSPRLLPQRCGKLPPKVAAENCSQKMRPKIYPTKVLPKAEVLQSCRAKLLLKAAP